MRLISGALVGLSSVVLFCEEAAQAQVLSEEDTCKIVAFLPFTDLRPGPSEDYAQPGIEYYGYGSYPNASYLGQASFSLMAAAELARRHFNARDTQIVPELAQLDKCNITMSVESNDIDGNSSGWSYLNSAHDRRFAVQQLQDVIKGSDGRSICAVIGPRDDFVSIGMAPLTEALGIPQIGTAIGYRLSRKMEFPTFARIIPEAYDFGATVPKFFNRDIFVRGNAGIIYDDTDYGEQYESPLEEAEEDLGYFTITESFNQGDVEAIGEALDEAKKNGYRTIIYVTDRTASLKVVARVAEDKEMLDGYLWILSGDALPPALLDSVQYEVDSPADRMLRGAALFTNYDRFVYHSSDDDASSDAFLTAWKNQDGPIVQELNKMQPRGPKGEPFYSADESYFQKEIPTEYASFMYDAVMAAGISACRAREMSDKGADQPFRHIHQVFRTEFHGASGLVRFKSQEDDDGNIEFENSREPSDLIYGIYNVRPGAIDENNMRGYETVLTHIYSNENEFVNADGGKEAGAWKAVEGTEFFFFDGTTNEPMPLRDLTNAHYISKGIRVTGIILSAVALILVVLTGVWTYWNRKHQNIKASQPEFLYLLCFVAALVAPSAIFVAFDEDSGKTEKQLDAMCAAVPWLFTVGYLTMYCALFSKLWRLSQLLQLRRNAVNIRQVLLPFVVIISSSLLVLIVWQTYSPLQWHREIILETEELFITYGECTSIGAGVLPFIIPLAFLIFLAVGSTAWFSWKLRDVQAELSESRWIFAGIFLHIQTWLVGVPIFYITDDVSREASFLMSVALTFTFSTSMVGLVIWPKVYEMIHERVFGGSQPTNVRTKVSIGRPRTHVSGIVHSSTENSARNLVQMDSGLHTHGTLTSSNSNLMGNNTVPKELSKHLQGSSKSLTPDMTSEIDSLRHQHTILSTKNAILEGKVSELEEKLQAATTGKLDSKYFEL